MKEIQESLALEMLEKNSSSWTNNKEFDSNGALLIKNVVDGSLLKRPKPERDEIYYYRKRKLEQKLPQEAQVSGSIETYNYPDYQHYHRHTVRRVIEKTIGRLVYPTYYYDRFYLEHQSLPPHIDRDACEISASLLISTSLEESWPLYVVQPSSNINELEAKMYNATDKDLIIYKGAECIHFRNNIPRGDHTHHQVFFHYVLQDGNRAYCAYDNGRIY